MLRRWYEGSDKLQVMPLVGGALHRRNRLSDRFPGEVLVIPTGHPKVRANDTYYPFRPGSDFYYLTGVAEPDCVLVLLPRGRHHEHLLFVSENFGKNDAGLLTDQNTSRLRKGYRPGVPGGMARSGITTRGLTELPSTLEAALTFANARARVVRGLSTHTETFLARRRVLVAERDAELTAFLSEMRLIKDADEIKALQSAVLATKRGFEDVIVRLKKATSERELEGVFWTRARMEGNDVGYSSIVAAGSHACTLHWNRNDGPLRKGDLLLLDAGVEGRSFYTADITRTLPISGKFTPEQRVIYDVVLDAQRAALNFVRPGNDFMAPERAAMTLIARSLKRLRILPISVKENISYRRYSPHNVSHMLGLDVHDCARARAEHYKHGKLEPGMVLTVEPGLYFQSKDLKVPARYRGIGVRIEDDVVVTPKGHRILSSSLPRDADEVEEWMHHLWRRA